MIYIIIIVLCFIYIYDIKTLTGRIAKLEKKQEEMEKDLIHLLYKNVRLHKGSKNK